MCVCDECICAYFERTHVVHVMSVGVYSLGHLVSVNATTPRASQHALTGRGAATCHIPGKFLSCLTCHIAYSTI